MKKLLTVLLLAIALGAFAACNRDGNQGPTLPPWVDGEAFTLSIGATARPHAEILEHIAPALLEEGLRLDIVPFDTFPVVNPALASGSIDANYFQHRPFLEASPYADRLYMVGLVHVEPIGMYSLTIDSIDDLPYGAVIAIPNDATNHGRALLLLQAHGLLTVDPAAGIRATYTSDILENPLNLTFRALDAAILPRVLTDDAIDAAVINTNHVLTGTNLNPVRDSLIIETSDSPFANGLTARYADRNHPAILLLLRHLQSQAVRDFIYEQYDGAVVTVF